MIRYGLLMIAGTAAIAIAAPAAAQGQSGTPAAPAEQASPTAQGPAAAPAQTNSQAPANASPTGTANASENSVLSTEEGSTGAVAADADATAKTKPDDKKSKLTVIRAGPNKGMVIQNGKKKATTEKADTAKDDPQQN